MDRDEFLAQVQDRARLDSRGTAQTATRATFETLSECLPRTVADGLSERLPQGVGAYLRRAAAGPDQPGTGTPMEYKEFLGRVARRAGTGMSKATHEARCVMEAVEVAAGSDLVGRVREALDDDLAQVLFAGVTGDVNPY